MYIMNNILFFKRHDHTPSGLNHFIETGTTTFPIVERSICIIKNILKSSKGCNTVNFIFNNIIFIPRFHINIVLELSLQKIGYKILY